MTTKQYDRLKQYEKHLRAVVKNSFMRMSQPEFNAIGEIYEELFNKTITNSERTCGTCKIRIVKNVANAYFKYQTDLATKMKREAEAEAKKTRKRTVRSKTDSNPATENAPEAINE